MSRRMNGRPVYSISLVHRTHSSLTEMRPTAKILTVLRSEILAELSSFSESHVLLECARLSGLRFALRGGIVRSLIVASALGKNFPIPSAYRESLFDLVDPFSDIDVVVDELVHWSRISTFIANALPLASYFRWEVSSLRQVTRLADTYERIPLDRFLLWFHPDGRTVKLDALDGMGDRTYRSLLENKIEATAPDEWVDKPDYDASSIAAALKLMRYRQQFGLEGPDPLTWLKAVNNAQLDPTAMQRIEFHILDVLLQHNKLLPR